MAANAGALLMPTAKVRTSSRVSIMSEPKKPLETVKARTEGSETPDADLAPHEPPKRIGRYRVVKALGEGGFGRVYLAHDDELDRPVAIKVPHRRRVASPRDVELYLTEARVVAGLDHAGIVPVHDVGRSDDGLCYVVSKFIEGSDLAARIQQSRLSHCESAALVATVAEALHYAHLQGLVGRVLAA